MVKDAVGTFQEVSGLLQGSAPVAVGWTVGVRVKLGVGELSGVWVKVGRGVSVGGSVLIGRAAWVSATMVKAIATAVLCRSSLEIAGVAGALPQALISKVSVRRMLDILTFILWG